MAIRRSTWLMRSPYNVPGFTRLTVTLAALPARFGQIDNNVTLAKDFGKWSEHWDGVDVTFNGRAINGLTFSGGVSTGRQTLDFCDVKANLPEIGPLDPYCAQQEPFLTQVKAQGTYMLPRIEVLISGTLQSNPGAALAANFTVPNAVVAPSLGRNLAGNAANVTVNLAKPGTLYGDRINQVDLRIAKVLTYGRTRTNVGIDLYNALNANPITSYNQTFGPQWLLPMQVLPARFMKVGFEFNF